MSVADHRAEPVGAPPTPGTIFGMARNTKPGDDGAAPQAFLKAPGSVIGPGEPIPLPEGIGRVDAEAELAVVIGTPLRHARPADVPAALHGCTVALDVTARDAQQSDSLWTEAKSRSGFTPLGPCVVGDVDLAGLRILLRVNGIEVASGTVDGLVHDPLTAVAYLSTLVELRPGDVVLTGAPGTFAPVVPGDEVVAEIPGVGSLGCPVVRSPLVEEDARG